MSLPPPLQNANWSGDIMRAANVIKAGGLVAMPTETVYGLAADATNDQAVARIYEAKGRPQFNPLIAHVADITMAAHYVRVTPLAERLAAQFWPGPLTLVLSCKDNTNLSHLVRAGLESLAVRAPAHPAAQALLKTVGRPLAAPSANPSGGVSPTSAAHVRAGLGDKVDLILTAPAGEIGVESTIVDLTDDTAPRILRPGGLAREEIEACLDVPLPLNRSKNHDTPIKAPGMLSSHYAPNARLRMNASTPRNDEAFLAFGPTPELSANAHALNLSAAGDLTEAAANLFAHLHQLDAMCTTQHLSGIAAAPIPLKGLGEAINDRLLRAAAPRSKS